MKRIIILLFLISNLFSNNLVDLYRQQGINAVQNKIDQLLKTKSYWLDFLKNKDISLGYYETKKFIILTQKNDKKLSLFKKEGNNFEKLHSSDVIIGEKFGDKYKEGDKKTPLGAYDLIVKKSKVDQFYGPFALVTSYPNSFDKSLKKEGHGIWIHGMPLNEKRELYTQGCIALDNEKLKQLDKSINLSKTILLTSEGKLRQIKKEEIALILSFIYKWRDAWKFSDINTYLSFYSNEFKKKNGRGIDYFKSYKTRVFKRKEKKKIKLTNINISPYPNSLDKNMFKVSMDEDYKSPAVKFIGKKNLYLEIINNQVKILSEG
ncbi:MAG: L,D-transpeptidase family protein [Arcobacter sp.]|nr:L,D-transpeptidase family protein [Arcobacter sp.]